MVRMDLCVRQDESEHFNLAVYMRGSLPSEITIPEAWYYGGLPYEKLFPQAPSFGGQYVLLEVRNATPEEEREASKAEGDRNLSKLTPDDISGEVLVLDTDFANIVKMVEEESKC